MTKELPKRRDSDVEDRWGCEQGSKDAGNIRVNHHPVEPRRERVERPPRRPPCGRGEPEAKKGRVGERVELCVLRGQEAGEKEGGRVTKRNGGTVETYLGRAHFPP